MQFYKLKTLCANIFAVYDVSWKYAMKHQTVKLGGFCKTAKQKLSMDTVFHKFNFEDLFKLTWCMRYNKELIFR